MEKLLASLSEKISSLENENRRLVTPKSKKPATKKGGAPERYNTWWSITHVRASGSFQPLHSGAHEKDAKAIYRLLVDSGNYDNLKLSRAYYPASRKLDKADFETVSNHDVR